MQLEGKSPVHTTLVVANGLPSRSRRIFRGVRVAVVPATTWYNPLKRIIDVLTALVLLILTFPLVLIAALLVKLTSRGPALYSQTRVGRDGQPFVIWKLRSMVVDSEKYGAQWSKKGDSRITAVGRVLRRTHIDELPQLWNVLRGDMSMIGPRPERPEFVPTLEAALPGYSGRLQVLPGVTGLAQIHLEADSDLASVERKLAMDLYYIKTMSFWTDFRILLATVVHVFKPYVADKWLFHLTPQKCAEAISACSTL